jgi:multidrug efflux pump
MIFGSVLAATLFTLFVVPIAYNLLARRNSSPGEVKRRLEAESAPPQEA